MTGYGRAESESNGRKITIEAKSVNHRFLEVGVKLSSRLFQLDKVIKEAVKARFSRGYFEITVTFGAEQEGAAAVSVNEPLLSGYMAAASDLSSRFNIAYPPSFGDLVQIKDLLSVSGQRWDLEEWEDIVKTALAAALDQVEKMREIEGACAYEDVSGRLDSIETLAGKIEQSHSASSGERLEKLRARITNLVGENTLDENRLAQEAALLADRSDISEELDRLKSHLSQVRALLSSGGPAGRKLEFFVQEINRESNTIGAKTTSAEATVSVVEIKSELEKIREQAQNIE